MLPTDLKHKDEEILKDILMIDFLKEIKWIIIENKNDHRVYEWS